MRPGLLTWPPSTRPAQPSGCWPRLAARPPTLGGGRLLCVDGPSGSGKTTLATRVSRLSVTSRVVHMDAMYDGWDGLRRVDEQLATLLTPLSEGRSGSYRRYDWHAGRYAETVTVGPAPLLILEGVGCLVAGVPLAGHAARCGSRRPPTSGWRERLARDGAAMEPHLRRWAVSEQEHFARVDTRAHADIAV